MATQKRKGWKRNIHVAIIVIVIATCGLFHYSDIFDPLGLSAFRLELGLSRYALGRILLLVPIIYANLTLGFVASLAATFIALVIMLPKAAFISVHPPDAFFEIAGVIVVGCTICFWFRAQAKQLQAAQQQQLEERLEFIATLSHELKTPLTSIIVSGGLLAGEIAKGTPQARLIQEINRGTHILRDRVSELLDLARGEAKTIELQLEPLDIRLVLQDVADSFYSLVKDKQQSLYLELPDSLPLVTADRRRLEQILSNLVANANKFTPEGGRITIRARQQDTDLLVEVQYDGIGLSEEEQAWLFQRYYQPDADRKYLSGSRLGLLLSRQLVELHGGRMWVESEKGKGTTFRFSLPITKTFPGEYRLQ